MGLTTAQRRIEKMVKHSVLQTALLSMILFAVVVFAFLVHGGAGRYQMMHPSGSRSVLILDTKTGELAVLADEADSAVVLQRVRPFLD